MKKFLAVFIVVVLVLGLFGGNLGAIASVRAIIMPATYTVTFDSQSGTPTPAPKTGIVANTTITLPDAPTLAGFTFNGWFTATTGGTAFNETTPVIANITVYAQWTVIAPVTYTVTFDKNGGD